MRRITYLLISLLLLLNIVAAPQTHASHAPPADEPKMCPVHHVSLKREQLEIVYGLVIDSCDTNDRAKAAEKYFPYAKSVIYGGCIIEPDSPRYKEVIYCSTCREVEKTWPCGLETRDTPIIKTLPPRKLPRP